MIEPRIVPAAEPFLLPGGPVGCLLIHGFTCSPEEMAWLGDDMAQRGHTVLGIRLAGHGTTPEDLRRTRWQDWMVSLEEGVALLSRLSEQVFLIGLSMGGVVALKAAADYPVTGVVAMSTPIQSFSLRALLAFRLLRLVRPTVPKGVGKHATLGRRREAGYPAYTEFPLRTLSEADKLQAAMRDALPRVDVPVLVLHSKSDAAVPVASAEQLFDQLGTANKEVHLLDGFDHALVRDPKRDEVFGAIADFIDGVLSPHLAR
jgi:carboxylesterase